MTRVIRDVDWTRLQPLTPETWRCCLAFVRHGDVDIAPVRATPHGATFRVELPRSVLTKIDLGQLVRLTFDAGTAWFELRAVTVRGRLVPPAFQDPDAERILCEVVPDRIGAWHYGTLREETGVGDDDHG